MRCDACKGVTFQISEKLKKASKKHRNLKESEYLELFEEACENKVYDDYGLKPVGGINRISGPGIKEVQDIPGVMSGGFKWPKRLAVMCGEMVGEIGEDDMYETFANGKSLSKVYCKKYCDDKGKKKKGKKGSNVAEKAEPEIQLMGTETKHGSVNDSQRERDDSLASGVGGGGSNRPSKLREKVRFSRPSSKLNQVSLVRRERAATAIQAHYRGFRVRLQQRRSKRGGGYVGRARASVAAARKYSMLDEDLAATQIQKVFRGYTVRKRTDRARSRGGGGSDRYGRPMPPPDNDVGGTRGMRPSKKYVNMPHQYLQPQAPTGKLTKRPLSAKASRRSPDNSPHRGRVPAKSPSASPMRGRPGNNRSPSSPQRPRKANKGPMR
eukprot:GFYU01007752.1.p1 GENE.GFYU01007752.1~~GFYU01007752.1.p1  ORF type:complete len:382 (-),score=93.03 GFYU01007752.1:215-1360(-)